MLWRIVGLAFGNIQGGFSTRKNKRHMITVEKCIQINIATHTYRVFTKLKKALTVPRIND